MEQNKILSTPLSRITVLDALRGFALLGVILMHMLQHYGYFSLGMEPREIQYPAFDAVIQWLSRNVIMGRFINIFAFLFGLSFFIQMDRAARKGIDFRKRFLWRMLVLFIIGMIGNCFYTGDILSIYAVFGVLMVFLFPVKNWILMIIVIFLLAGVPRVLTNYDRIAKTEQVENTRQASPVNVSSENRSNERSTPRVAEADREKSSFFDSAKNNLTIGLQGKLNYQFGIFGRGYLTFALFLLGLIVGRLRFFEEVHIRMKRNLILFAGFILALIVVSWIANLLPEASWRSMREGTLSPLLLIRMTLNDIITVISAGALAMGFIILYHTKSIGQYLDVLSPYGRMGLTNYLMQSIIGSIIFSPWGFGSFFANWQATEVFCLGLIVYIEQAVFSKVWLTYYIYGPLEWFWRSATYLKIQPFRRK